MKFAKRLLTTLAAAGALMAAGHASAVTWAFSYTGAGVSASGTFTTAGNATSPENILSISGQRNGVPIIGLVPLGTNTTFSYDNQFSSVGEPFTLDGLLYNVGGGEAGIVNVYVDAGQVLDLRVISGVPFEVPITFNVSAVPEAATVAQLSLGLAGLAVVAVRRRRAAQAA